METVVSEEEATKTATPFKTVSGSSDNRADDQYFPGDSNYGLKISQTIKIEKTLHEQTRTK